MHMISLLVGGALAAASGAALGQPVPQAHEQHQAPAQPHSAGQHPSAPGKAKCCCEEMMHKMMETMHQHQGASAKPAKEGPQTDKQHAH